MNKIQKIDYFDLIDVTKKISNPFSREVFIGEIKKKYGKGSTVFYDLGNGIAVFVRSFTPKEDLVLFENCEIAGTSLIFNLGSDINFIYKDKKEYILRKEHFIVGLSSNKFYVEIPLKRNEPLITFTIGLKEELFFKLTHNIENIQSYIKIAKDKSYCILSEAQIDTIQFELFRHFKNEKLFEDLLKSIYLESKTNDLIHYTIEKLSKQLDSTSTKIDQNRISSLKRAKEIILKEYKNNLSIKQIAYKSAINECYLKKDFKSYYGMTIHQMLQKHRLEMAKKFLKENYSVKEVALKVGYKHTGHFSKIFTQSFDISPNKYRKQFTNN